MGGSGSADVLFNTTTRRLAEKDELRILLFECPMERLQVMRRRFPGTQKNQHDFWTIVDATIGRTDGVNWKSMEYFLHSPADLLQDCHPGIEREYQIAEIELMMPVGVVAFWRDIWDGGESFLSGADNPDTFSWLKIEFRNGGSIWESSQRLMIGA